MGKITETANRLGLPVIRQHDGAPCRVVINGYKIAPKGTFRIGRTQGKHYLRFSRISLRREKVDFFICVFHAEEGDLYFIIPYDEMPKSGPTIRVKGATTSQKEAFSVSSDKYSRYKEAWQLLENPY